MENLDFGWQVALLVFLLEVVYYYFVAVINYLLVVTIGELFKKHTDKLTLSKKNNIVSNGLPFLLSALIIEMVKIYGLGSFAYFFSWNSVFIDPNYYHLPGIYAYVIGMTCLSLTRYSYSDNWLLLGRLKRKNLVLNFIIWTTVALLITIIFRDALSLFLPEFFGYAVIYPLLIALFTYLFFKKRNLIYLEKAISR